MPTTLLGPGGLEVDAVVPQCLDNQCVSDSVFSKMMAESVDYTNEGIESLREKEFNNEFMRSLIYSSQVVIQRAFLKNNHFLYNNFSLEPQKDLPEEREKAKAKFEAFANLIRRTKKIVEGKEIEEQAIVPFLFDESSLRDQLKFDLTKRGDRAVHTLLDALGDEVTCVRLAKDDPGCKLKCKIMAGDFTARLVRLRSMGPDLRNGMADELFLAPSRLQEEGMWNKFNEAINELADYAYEKGGKLAAKGEVLTRNHVYRDRFVVDGPDAVVHGQFKRPDHDNPFLLELKKYVDLAYNTNLPDKLERYTFTPENMPSRMALQDAPGVSYTADDVYQLLTQQDAVTAICRAFEAHTNKAMSLPLLNELSVVDVHEIRALPAWTVFKDSQAEILKNPLQVLERIETFQHHFDNFQRSLSSWYNIKYKRPGTEKQYASCVSFLLDIGGQIIVSGSHLPENEKVLGKVFTRWAAENIPEKVMGAVVKLMVGVYDMKAGRLDADRSYSVDLMKTNSELAREDIEVLLNSIRRKGDDALPRAAGHFADQGNK